MDMLQKLHPREYLKRHVDQNHRPDGRGFQDLRNLIITKEPLSNTNGSAVVQLGNTSVLCSITAEVAIPTINSPNLGYFVPQVDLDPLSSTRSTLGSAAPLAQTLSQIIIDIHNRSNFLDMQSLCIQQGQAVWVLYANILCLSNDGNLLDAALFALYAALKAVRLPKAQFDQEQGIVRAPSQKTESLVLNNLPLSCSFISFEDRLISDPTAQEEELASHMCTIVLDGNREGKLLGIFKLGGNPLEFPKIAECIERASHHIRNLHKQHIL